MCRPGSSSLLLSQQLELLSTLSSQQLCLLRPLLVKQGYLSPFSLKFILNELGDGGVLSLWTQSGQHCAYVSLPYRRTQSFDGFPIDLTQMGVALVRWMEVFRFIIQRVYIRWTDY